ncbi:dolichyl-diphosphooligosaccharide--protein glycosyltransferase subunit 1a [Quercus suber]|uniref:Dolichyl-diphosphooligosaccharide--protein glycosyltransferase subunit 1a n=1 Tax=Quercus suber TaxID=58331 RepID=A0AAW0MB99_QUESU
MYKVYYKFSNLSMLREPLMLISGFFLLFVAGIIYMHADLAISKSSPSYLAKLQWDEVLAVIQQFQNNINRCLTIHDKLDASLRDLSRTGDVQACKAARKAFDGLLKDLSKDLKPLLAFLQSSPQTSQILPKVQLLFIAYSMYACIETQIKLNISVEELVVKEKDLQEKLMAKHSMVVDGYEKKSGGREIENRIASQQQKITALRQEVDDLLEFIDEI